MDEDIFDPDISGPIVTTDPFDLAPIRQGLARYEVQIEAMVQEAEALEVTDPASDVLATEAGTSAKKLNKSIDKARKEAIEKPQEYIRAVNGLAKWYQEKLADIETILKRKIGVYQARREMERREAERAAQEAARKLQAQLDAEAKAKRIEAPTVPVPVMPEPIRTTRTEAGTSSQRKVWTFRITNPEQVPAEYKMVDEKRIREAVRMGVRSIEGVEIYQESTTTFRTN